MATGGCDRMSLEDIVICDVCFQVMVKPQALSCLHHFCSACVTGMMDAINHPTTGVQCPLCKRFTPELEIQDSFVMNNLLAIFCSRESQGKIGDGNSVGKFRKKGKLCLQCGRAGGTAFCNNCEIELCDSCKDGHVRIPACKTHMVTDLENTESERKQVVIVEEFCKLHPDCKIQFNCVPCNATICVKCREESHDNHHTESVENALNTILAESNYYVKSLCESTNELKQQLQLLTDLKINSQHRIESKTKQISDHRSEMIAKIDTDCNELLETASSEHTARTKELDELILKGENRLSTKKSLLAWADTITGTGSGRLQELQGDLREQLKAGALDKAPAIAVPEFSECEFKPSRTSKDTNCVGSFTTSMAIQAECSKEPPKPKEPPRPDTKELTFHTGPLTMLKIENNIKSFRQSSISFSSFKKTSFFKSPRKVTLMDTYLLNTTAGFRLCLYKNNKILIPKRNTIHIYSMDGEVLGNIVSENVFSKSWSVHPLGDNYMILADHSGLFVLDLQTKVISKVMTGDCLDLHVEGSTIVVLEEIAKDQGRVHVLTSVTPLTIKHSFILEQKPIQSIMILNNCVFVSFEGNSTNKEISHISKYSLQGEKLAQYGRYGTGVGELNTPMLCGSDPDGSLLIADWHNGRLQVLAADGEWSVFLKKPHQADFRNLLDVVFDGDQFMYVLSSTTKYKRMILKYKIK